MKCPVSNESFLQLKRWPSELGLFAALVLVACGTAAPALADDVSPRFVQELPEAGRGEFVKCDLQQRFSDSEMTATQFLARAVDGGCRVVIVAPPTPTDNPAALSRFLQEVAAAQKGFPKTLVLPAFSWSIRARGSSGRANILLPPGDDFTSRFLELPKLLVKSGSDITMADSLAQSLQKLCPDDRPAAHWPVILFDQFRDGTTLHRWSVEPYAPGELWAQGGQRERPVLGQSGLLDRWDQSDIRSGGEWDQLLADGWNAWAASENLDLVLQTSARTKPGEFTETWLRMPEFTAEHALESLRCGAFYGVRGGAARDVEFSVIVPGLSRPALTGETIDVPAGTPIRVHLSLTIPDKDWKQAPNRLDGIELVGVTPESSQILHKIAPGVGRVEMDYETEVPEGGILFRALGYKVIKDGADHSFYTNSIRIIADGRWERPQVKVVREHWLREHSSLWVAWLLIGLSLFAVGGWLVSTGQMSLLIGDSFDPLIRVWTKSKSYRWLLRNFPALSKRSSQETETIGTSLTEQECRWLVAALITGTTLLGALAGGLWGPAHLRGLPQLQGPVPGALCGAAIGGAIGVICRFRPFFGLWLWIVIQTLTVAFPQAGLAGLLPSLLIMALMGFVIQEPLQTGTVRWPADLPVAGLLSLLGFAFAMGAAATAAPPFWGDFALLLGLLAVAGWNYLNARSARTPLRLVALMFVMTLWIGGTLAQRTPVDAPPSPLWGMHLLIEALGVAVLWSASQPRRLDAVSVFLILPVFSMLTVTFMPEMQNLDAQFLAAAGLITALTLCAAETSSLWKICGAVAAAGLGRMLLLAPHQPGVWLIGSLACLAAGLANRSSLRMLLFLFPYVLIGGFLTLMHSPAPSANELPISSFVALVQQEIASLRTEISESPGVIVTAGQFLSLFSLAGLAAFYWSIRDRHPADIFDGAGRISLAALLFCGVACLMNLPLPGSAILVLSPLVGLWAAQLRPEGQTIPQPTDFDALDERVWQRMRFRLGATAAVIAGLIAYGSLVPFHWRDVAWMQAVQEFLDQIRSPHVWTRLNSDRLVNVLLTVPLAGCAYGSLVLGRRGIAPRIWSVFEAGQFSLVVSLLVEMAQSWSVGRFASVEDVVAQAIGAGLGILAWVFLGERFITRWAASWKEQSPAGRWTQLLWPYLLGVLVFAVLPAGLPATSPKQLYDRYRDGQLTHIPFADCQTWDQLLRDAVVGVLLFIPVGVWGTTAFCKPGQPLRSLWTATANGTAFAALITVVRALCSLEMTDSSWLLTGLVGSFLGAATVHYWARYPFDEYATWKNGMGWWMLSLVFAGIMAGNFLHPWMFDATQEQVASHWKRFVDTPFAGFHTGDDLLLIEEVVRKLAWFGALGILLGHAVCRTTELRAGRIIGGGVAALLAAGVACGIEFGQIHQTRHSAEITDVLIYVIGALLGLWTRFFWLNDSVVEENSRSDIRETAAGLARPNPQWTAIVQTTVAIGFLLGLLAGIALLFLKR